MSIENKLNKPQSQPGMIDRLLQREHGVEPFWKKVVRHALTGDFHPRTLRRGLESLKMYLSSLGNETSFKLSRTEWDLAGNKDVDVFRYDTSRMRRNGEVLVGQAVVVEFPSLSEIRLWECEEQSDIYAGSHISEKSYVKRYPGAFAAFIGPTREEYYPNNGYFSQSKGLTIPFMDTNPPGKRRGALAITKDGKFTILDEVARTKARDTSFEGYALVSGTSFYLLSSDDADGVELFARLDRTRVSYLVSYTDENDLARIAHVNFAALVNRQDAKLLIDEHSASRGWKNYIAAELEYEGGGCVFVNQEDYFASTTAGNGSSYILDSRRFDHYIICRQEEIA
jgi:hypothetical protein